jgi:hypothetical protein
MDGRVSQKHGADTVAQFCERHRISRAFLYVLWAQGRGPRYMQVGTRRLISDEAAAAWRRQMEIRAA